MKLKLGSVARWFLFLAAVSVSEVQGAGYGGMCNPDMKCDDPNSYCQKQDVCYEGTCVCNDGFKYSSFEDACLPGTYIMFEHL